MLKCRRLSCALPEWQLNVSELCLGRVFADILRRNCLTAKHLVAAVLNAADKPIAKAGRACAVGPAITYLYRRLAGVYDSSHPVTEKLRHISLGVKMARLELCICGPGCCRLLSKRFIGPRLDQLSFNA